MKNKQWNRQQRNTHKAPCRITSNFMEKYDSNIRRTMQIQPVLFCQTTTKLMEKIGKNHETKTLM